jgi:hypothetical protein
MSDERATDEEMTEAQKRQEFYDAGFVAGQAEIKAELSRPEFDDWSSTNILPEKDALWLAWKEGFECGWMAANQ